jgi:hypothetical protein
MELGLERMVKPVFGSPHRLTTIWAVDRVFLSIFLPLFISQHSFEYPPRWPLFDKITGLL